MVAVYYSKHFLLQLKKLPKPQQVKLTDLIELLKVSPFHPKLHAKHLTGTLSGLFSFRITRDWRVIFQFLSAREIRLVDVAHRKDIYRK